MPLKNLVPHPLLSAFHFVVAHVAAIFHEHPSRDITVIGVTGTKGKTSTTEMLYSIFNAAGKKTALINSIRVAYGDESQKNAIGRSMPGRGFLQHFLSTATQKNCEVAIIEMTSEGARQHRHRAIDMDALIFLNLAPEHIESHGSYEAYADAKYEIGKQLERSLKRPRIIIANARDKEAARYLALRVEKVIPFDLSKHEHHASATGGSLILDGTTLRISLPGEFSLENALAAGAAAHALSIALEKIADGLSSITKIPGRAEYIDEGQDFTVVVDYAHTPESLRALISAFGESKKICVLGSAGGGRDVWKRPVMGKIAEENCHTVILSNDAPYGEDPNKILGEIRTGMRKDPIVLPDRRDAVEKAIMLAGTGDVVLLTGMGLDSIVDADGNDLGISEMEVARIAIRKRLSRQV